MVNLWGPGAFGAARPAAVRPTFTPADGAGDPDDWAQDCSSPTARDGTEWRSALLNEIIAQLRGVARNSSVAPSNLNPVLLAQAIASGNFTWAAATGTANAWVVAPALAVPAYAAGRVLWVKAPGTNTDSTVTANVSGRGDRPVKKRDGTDPAIGDLVAGTFYPTIDDGTTIRVVAPLASDIKFAADPFNLVVTTFDSSGSWTVPTGVKFAFIECWGAGGGGGAGDSASLGGFGGGGGLYAGAYKSVTPGDVHPITIGVGGISASAAGNFGLGGGSTSCGTLVTAGGGGGGGHAGMTPGVGATTSSGAQIVVPGGGAFVRMASGIGTPGGNGANGAQGGQQGNSGSQPGGGAAGNSFNNLYSGQKGGDGRVQITYAAS